MKTPPWLTALLFLGCLVLGSLWLKERTAVMQVTVSRDAADKENRDTRAQNTGLEHQLAETKAALALAEKQAARSAAESAAGAGASRQQAGNGRSAPNVVHISDIIKDHPDYLALYAKQTRRNIDRTYYGGLGALNLPSDQLSRLKDLLAERQMNNLDAQAVADAAGVERSSPAWQDAMKQAAQDTQQQINDILGGNAEGTLAQLQAKAGLQSQVERNYAPEFAEAGATLSREQSDALVQALADANYAGKDLSARPFGYNNPDPTSGLTAHNLRILNSAASVLSPTQIQILKSDMVDENRINAIENLYNKPGGSTIFVP